MKALSPEELKELRKEIASLDIPEERQDELIRLIDSIVISWIDQAFGLHPVQLSLSARANYAFEKHIDCDIFGKSQASEAAPPGNGNAAIPDTRKTGPRP